MPTPTNPLPLPTHDYQRERVYEAQDKWVYDLFIEYEDSEALLQAGLLVPIHYVDGVARTIFDSHWFNKLITALPLGYPIVWRAARITNARVFTSLHTWFNQPDGPIYTYMALPNKRELYLLTIAHELAHIAATPLAEYHAPEFCWLLLHILKRLCGKDRAAALKSLFDARRVKYRKPPWLKRAT
jgi:hypothetical protein